MLPMVKIAKAKGYDIIILNPNLNKTTVNGIDMPIPVRHNTIITVIVYSNTILCNV